MGSDRGLEHSYWPPKLGPHMMVLSALGPQWSGLTHGVRPVVMSTGHSSFSLAKKVSEHPLSKVATQESL